MKALWISTGAVLFLGASACGGAGGSGSAPGVAGTITTRDGSTSDLSGVTLTCPETGSSDVSDVRGKFTISVPRGVTFHLEVDDPEAEGSLPGEGDCDETGDETGDGSDIQGKVVEIEEIPEGESCEIEIEIVDGEIVTVCVSKGDGEGGDDKSGEGVLLPLLKGEGYGEVEIRAEHGCVRVEVEAEGIPLGVHEVVLLGADLGEFLLGTLAVEVKEEKALGRLVFEACLEGGLPFGLPAPEELAGLSIVVRTADGLVLLEGTVPSVGVKDDEPGEEKDEEEGKGDDEEKGEGEGKGDEPEKD